MKISQSWWIKMALSERSFIPFNLLYFQVSAVRRGIGDRRTKRQRREIKGKEKKIFLYKVY